MEDEGLRNYYLFLQALREFPDSLPEELRQITLAEAKRMWQDPEQRAKLQPAVEKVARAAEPVLQEVAAAFRAIDTGLTQVVGMIQRLQECVRQTAETIAGIVRFGVALPHLAASYCEPWQQQIRALQEGAFPPLTSEEEQRFMFAGWLVSYYLGEEGDLRPPLEWVSLVANRVDIAVAVLGDRFPDLPKRLLDFREPEQDWRDLQADVLRLLGDRILPGIASRLGDLAIPEACRLLQLQLTEQYLGVALRHDAIDRKRAQQRRERVETVDLARVEELIPDRRWMAPEEALSVRIIVEEYLGQSERPEVDRRIVEAIRDETPPARLEAETRVPARSLRDRRRRLLDWCRRRLGWES